MIQGVAILRVSQMRTPIEMATTTASVSTAAFGGFRTVTRGRSGHAVSRGRERSTARANLPQALGDVAQRAPIGREPRLRRRARHLAKDGILDHNAAGCLLEGCDIGLGDPLEPVLALRQSPRGVA